MENTQTQNPNGEVLLDEKVEAPETTTEDSNTHQIPKASFDAVSEKYKSEKAQREALEKRISEIETQKLKEKEDFKGLAERLEKELSSVKLDNLKKDLIQEAITKNQLSARLSKIVVGSNEEEIKKSLEEAKAFYKETLEEIKKEKTAYDSSGMPKKQKQSISSREEFKELYAKNPEEARRQLIAETSGKR